MLTETLYKRTLVKNLIASKKKEILQLDESLCYFEKKGHATQMKFSEKNFYVPMSNAKNLDL